MSTGNQRVSFEGPFQTWRVLVDGQEVPHLSAQPKDGGRVVLCCDNAQAIELPVHEMEHVAAFVSFAMQVAIRGARWVPIHDVMLDAKDSP